MTREKNFIKRPSLATKELLGLLLVVFILIILNLAGSVWYTRIDLTSESRYTLAGNTKQLLGELTRPITVDIYLKGDLNPGFRKLANGTADLLDEFDQYAGSGISYRWIDPNGLTSAQETKKLYSLFQQHRCAAVPVFDETEDGSKKQSNVFPYAFVYYEDTLAVVNLLDNIYGNSGAENLNKSIESLEFKFTTALRKLCRDRKPSVAFVEGHGELDSLDVFDATNTLREIFDVKRVRIESDASVLDPYKVAILAKPQEAFSEKDKYIIDQYLMRGGSLIWMVDAVNITLDSLRRSPETIGLMSDVNIGDQLFKYGVRINPYLIEDVQCAKIKMNAAPAGSPPNLVPVPWRFNPLLFASSSNPVTRNINQVKGEFVSVIDTVGEGLPLKRSVLLTTSKYTKVHEVPVFVSMGMINERPMRQEFNRSYLPVAFLLEGSFPSVFQNRTMPGGITQPVHPFLSSSKPARMIVVADGDLIKNRVMSRFSNPYYEQLGYDEATGQVLFGNSDFIVNAVSYLADDEGWMNLRSRSYQLRMLDKEILTNHSGWWKLLNMIAPILIVILGGLIFYLIRRKIYL